MFIDLQLHSTYSDGYLTPTELASFLAKQNVKVAALTDHNTVGGLDEFHQACRTRKIKAIAGLELYVKLNHRLFNILWLNLNDGSPELHQILRNTQIRRRNKTRAMLENLQERGLQIDVDRVIDKYNHYVPINRVIDDIMAVRSNRQRIEKELGRKNPREGDIMKEYFFNKNRPKFINSYVSLSRIASLKKKIGGQIILNHPGKYGFFNWEILGRLKKMGVDGIEALSPHHTIGAVMYAQYVAREFQFYESGGSDFHRFEGNNGNLKHSWEYFKIDSKYLNNIEKIIG